MLVHSHKYKINVCIYECLTEVESFNSENHIKFLTSTCLVPVCKCQFSDITQARVV